MRTWLATSAMDADLRREADLGASYSAASHFLPDCWRCSKAAKNTIKVVSFGVEDSGKLPGSTGNFYTDFFAECNHGTKIKEKEIIRIEGFRWDDWEKDGYSGDTIARLAAMRKLPFFKGGNSPRCIPLSDYRNFIGSWKGL